MSDRQRKTQSSVRRERKKKSWGVVELIASKEEKHWHKQEKHNYAGNPCDRLLSLRQCQISPSSATKVRVHRFEQKEKAVKA